MVMACTHQRSMMHGSTAGDGRIEAVFRAFAMLYDCKTFSSHSSFQVTRCPSENPFISACSRAAFTSAVLHALLQLKQHTQVIFSRTDIPMIFHTSLCEWSLQSRGMPHRAANAVPARLQCRRHNRAQRPPMAPPTATPARQPPTIPAQPNRPLPPASIAAPRLILREQA